MNSPLITHKGKPVILAFFDGHDRLARPGFGGYLKSQAHFHARVWKRHLKGQSLHSGFYSAFRGLTTCLEQAGCEVKINDFEYAAAHPYYPICLAGFPTVLQNVNLPNPVLFGPGNWGMPEESKPLIENPKLRKLMQPSEWFADIYKPYCGDKIWVWFAPIDTKAIEDTSSHAKQYDCLIYDKILWDRDKKVPQILQKIKDHLEEQKRTYKVLRYGEHLNKKYMEALSQSRSVIFICEHETQGLACQEALASNVPVLAWNEGEMIDERFKPYMRPEINVSSVPYFDQRCGETFKAAEFESKFDLFWSKRDQYQPRVFVQENLSMEIAAKRYLDMYTAVANEA